MPTFHWVNLDKPLFKLQGVVEEGQATFHEEFGVKFHRSQTDTGAALVTDVVALRGSSFSFTVSVCVCVLNV